MKILNLLWKYGRFGVFLLLVLLITISSHPRVVDISSSEGIQTGTFLSRYIILVFGALFVLTFNYFNFKSYFRSKTLIVSWVALIFIFLYYLITASFYGTKNMMDDGRAILISVGAIMIGWEMSLDKKQMYFILLAFAGLTLYVGVMQVITNIGGFEIHDQYESDNKNALGAMLSVAAIIFLFIGLDWKKIGWVRFVFFAGVLATIVVMLTIRARTATLSCGLMLLYIFYERYKKKHFWAFFIGGVALVIILYCFMPQFVKDYVYDSFYQNYENDDVTSDRLNRIAAGLRFLSQHFWVGNLNAYTTLAWIHNYPLEKMYKYGFIFSFPILFIYLYLLIYIIIKTAKSDNYNIFNIGYYLLLVPYIISMAEPTFPFGPGTANVFNFIMFGIALRSSHNMVDNDKHSINDESNSNEGL